MKSSIISFLFAAGILVGSCSTSRDVRMTDREERDDGTVIKRERRVDDEGVVIKNQKRDKEILERDEDDRDTEIRINRDRDRDRDNNRDEPLVEVERDNNPF